MTGMAAVILKSTSRAEDAGFVALADVAAITGRLDVDYRLIGGHMVSLLVAAHGATGAPARETSDADLGAEFSVVGDQRLIDALTRLGYTRPGASNRFFRRGRPAGSHRHVGRRAARLRRRRPA